MGLFRAPPAGLQFDPSRCRTQEPEMPGSQPKAQFTDADIARLQALLMSRAVPAGGMNLEMLDGFLCGLIVGPADVPSDEYEPLIWGMPPSRWESAAACAEADQLVQRLANFIKARIAIDPERVDATILPLLSMPPDLPDDPAELEAAIETVDYPLGAAWAGGFLQAIDLRLPEWRILEQQVDGLQRSIDRMLRLIQLEPTPGQGLPPPTFHERLNMMGAMPFMLRILDHRRRADRARQAPNRTH
jgi:uncharacterized protein